MDALTLDRAMTKVLRFGGSCLLAFGLLLAAAIGVGLAFDWWRVVPVQSGSMAPAIPTGAAVLATPEPFSDVRVGQVIISDPPTPGTELLVHRVAAAESRSGRSVVRTWGDANEAPDPWTAELQNPPAWRVRWVVPHVGMVIDLVRNPVLRLALFGLALVGMTVAFAGTISNLTTRPTPPESANPPEPSLPA